MTASPAARVTLAEARPALSSSEFPAAAVVIGNHTQGLGIVRSAGIAGRPAWMVNDGPFGLARFSRYITGYRRMPRGTLAALDRPEVAAALVAELRRLPVGPGSVLFGVNEDITRFIFEQRAKLADQFHVPGGALDQIYDKYQFNRSLPEPARLDTRLWREEWLGLGDPDRFLVKGRQGNAFRRHTGVKAMPLSRFASYDRAGLFAVLRPEDVLLQKRVRSSRPVVSFCSFASGGQVVASFMYEKLRQHPDEFGTGTYLRSMWDEAIATLGAGVLAQHGFTGISEIEFIHDPDTDAWHGIEMNPRTWKSIHFASQCGRNFVDTFLRHANSRPIPPVPGHAIDCYWADLLTDLSQMFRDRRMHRRKRGFFECAWDRRDPLPAVALWILLPWLYLERRWTHGSRAALTVASFDWLYAMPPVGGMT
jgi:predicted ATP-grasp superfamily ATP-dependent carboligase